MGRPKLPEGRKKNAVIKVKCTESFKKKLYSRLREEGKNPSKYIRGLIEEELKKK